MSRILMNGCADYFLLPQTLARVWFHCQTDAVDSKWQNAGKEPQWRRILRKLANGVTFDTSVSTYKLFVGVSRRLWLNYRPKRKAIRFTSGFGFLKSFVLAQKAQLITSCWSQVDIFEFGCIHKTNILLFLVLPCYKNLCWIFYYNM